MAAVGSQANGILEGSNTSPPPGSCPVCPMIARAIARWHPELGGLHVRLGKWKGFLERRDCECCQAIVQHMKCRDPFLKYGPQCPLILRAHQGEIMIGIDHGDDPCGHEVARHHPTLFLLASRDLRPDTNYFIELGESSIDFSRVGRWMLFCDDHHQGFCHTMLPWQTISHANSLILIDLQRACLARTAGNFTLKYIALSYVWGVLPSILESNINNIDHLCIPGSLDKLENLSRIPRTIRDAMTLTKAMNIRYLWVDRLCIIQDDFYHFRDQIQQMASVFANSYFTIIAADGNDANYGLHGVDSDSSPRYYKRSIFRFSESAHMVAQPEVESHRNPKVWHTRGWTFQERAVSRRTLVFTKETVYWQCRRAAWHESQAAAPDGVLLSGPQSAVPRGAASSWPSYALRLNPWPDLQQYFELVTGYNDRKLTFERDALNAFTAITSAMSCTFQGGFHWGIPVLVFDIGLLWSRFSPLMRRKDFPSWSWLGWSGSVILPKGYEEAWDPAFVCWEPVVEVSPLFKWYVADDQGHSVGLIDNSYYRYSSAASQPDLQLPEGWSATCDKSYRCKGFAHVSLPEQTFRFPFPAVPQVPERSFSSLLLKFSSQSCTMSLGTAFAQQEAYPTCLIVDVMDNNGRWAGIVESLFVEEDEYTHGQECELVAVSTGCALRRDEDDDYCFQAFDEMFRIAELGDIDKYEFNNVLWIEREQGVAYRKAIGRIWAPVWKHQDLKDVEILLG